MRSNDLFNIAMAISAAGFANASPALTARQSCDEGSKRICYGKDGGASQQLDTYDVEFVGQYFRYLAESNTGAAARYTMPIGTGACQEWSIEVPGSGTVLAVAKHTVPFVATSVLFEDMASTIDAAGGLLECAEGGGQMPIKVNKTNPVYSSAEYKATKARPDGITLKLVKNPSK